MTVFATIAGQLGCLLERCKARRVWIVALRIPTSNVTAQTLRIKVTRNHAARIGRLDQRLGCRKVLAVFPDLEGLGVTITAGFAATNFKLSSRA